ncbi:MAG TPA: autotransporter-associated beta strand repeat-containing protein, partial [Micromonosporaceae bacterium]
MKTTALTVLRLLLLGTAFAALAGSTRAATTLWYWSGGSANSGNWSTGANWLGGVAPTGGDQRLIFQANALRKVNTNNLPAGTTFESIWVVDDGYNIYGNPVRTDYLRARCPTGTSTTFRPDIVASADLQIIVETNNSTFNVMGDISLTADDVIFPSSSPGDVTISGVISGTGNVWKQNVGQVSFAGLGANTYVGTTYVSGGVLRLGRYNIGGGLALLGTTAIPGNLVIGGFVSTLIGDIVVLDRDNQIANTATVYVYPTGSLELSDENDTIGELRLAGGTVTTGTGVFGVEGGIYALAPVNVSKDSLIAGRLTLGARGDEPQLVDVAQGVQLNIPAQISGVSTAHLIKTNRGELVLSSSNVFSGDVEIFGGTVTILHGSALGNTTGVTRPVLGTLAISGSIGIPESLEVPGPAGTLMVNSGSPSWQGSVVLNDDLGIYVPTNSFLTILGLISGPAGWTKYGPGTLQFKTLLTNTYAGTGWVREGDMILDGVLNQPVISGSLVIGHTNNPPGSERVSYIKQQQIGDSVPVTIHKSGLLALQGFNDTIGSLAGTGGVDLGSGVLTVGANGDSTTYAGVISGAGSLVKTGAGALTVTGTNTYTGITTNLNGALRVNGRLNGSPVVQVRPGSLLGGTGLVQSISVFAGAQVSPGTSPGNLTAAGSVLLSSGTLNIELNGTAVGTGYDRLTAAGTVTLGGALSVNLGFTPAVGDSFTILEKTGGGAVSGTFSGLSEGAVFDVGGVSLQISYTAGTGNDVVLTRVSVVAPNISSITPITAERMQILGQGLPGAIYVLEATLHLNEPIPWTPVATNTANGMGIYEFIEPYADNGNPVYPQR